MRNRPHNADWHAERLAEGPQGFIRARGAVTWDMLQTMCRKFVADWERLPPAERLAYAFPNPEDRRRPGFVSEGLMTKDRSNETVPFKWTSWLSCAGQGPTRDDIIQGAALARGVFPEKTTEDAHD